MKRITTLFAAASMLLSVPALKAQVAVARDSSYMEEQLASSFPGTYVLGGFVVSAPAGSSLEQIRLPIFLSKGGAATYEYTGISSGTVWISYQSSGTPISYSFTALFLPGAGGIEQVIVTPGFSIVPDSGSLRIGIDAVLAPGLDTSVDKITVSCSVVCSLVSGVTDTGGPATSLTTYVNEVVTSKPFGSPDRTFTSLPIFSEIVGTFVLQANAETDVEQVQVESDGVLNGSLPAFTNPRLVDSLGTVLSSYPGTLSGPLYFYLPPGTMHLAQGESRRLFVLSDIISATPGDYFQTAIMGACGNADSSADIPMTIGYCSNNGELLGEKALYAPATGVPPLCQCKAVSVYPNPVTDAFTIDCATAWRVEISDITGRAIRTVSGKGTQVIPRNNIVPGLYLITLVTESDVITQKIVFN